MKIQLNCFYRTDFFYGTDEFTLAEMTDAYRDEWQANKGWLRLGFHSLQEFPDYPFGKFDYAYDRETKIGLKELEDLQQIGAINIYEVAELPKMFKKVIGNEFITFGDHEQYFHKDYFHYQSDYAEKIFTCGKLLQDAGYEFFFLEELAAEP